ncbi:alkaline phosphatase, partial [bacterium]|nr:alkaline phosphatase [bacterium]
MIARPLVRLLAHGALAVLVATSAHARDTTPLRARNVIVMVGDGAGYNTWAISEMFDGTTGAAFHDAPGWVHVAASTYALRQSRNVAEPDADPLAQDGTLVYDPAKAWDAGPPDTTTAGLPRAAFAGYQWLLRAPDSANTATTLSTGVKTYCGAINVDGAGTPIRDTLAHLAKDAGKRVGVVTTVPFPHATPAALGGAHSPNRSDYPALAREMLTSGVLDVIAGAANPDYDHNGLPIEDPARRVYRYVGGPLVWT